MTLTLLNVLQYLLVYHSRHDVEILAHEVCMKILLTLSPAAK